MPRQDGWRPLSYTVIAHICGRIIRGDLPGEIARDHRIDKVSLRSIKLSLAATGVVVPRFRCMPTAEKKAEIARLVRTTRMTNQEIRRAVGLPYTTMPRAHRFAYYRELEKEGRPVPRCDCGDVFEHTHLCPFRGLRGPGRRERELEDTDIRGIMQDLRDGLHHTEIMERHQIGARIVWRIGRRMTKSDRSKRKRNRVSPKAREERQRQALEGGNSLFERLGIAINRVDPEIRDDVHQMMAIEVLDGRLTEKEAIKRLSQFVTKAYGQGVDRWRSVSLDSDGAGDEMSLSERLADDTALAAFDEVEMVSADPADW